MPILILLMWGRYSCELHHGLHSWVGAATDGGYLGSDARAFVSAVLSGAAGYYALALVGDAGVGTDLVIRPGQDVRISGGTSSWGGGGFAVQEHGSLSLTNLEASRFLDVAPNASVVLSQVSWHGVVFSGIISRGADGTYSQDATSLIRAALIRGNDRLYVLSPRAFGGSHNIQDLRQYVNACQSLGLRPVVSRSHMGDCCGADQSFELYGNRDNRIIVHTTADYGYSEFFVGLGAATGWLHDCQGDAPCAGPPLVVFSPYGASHTSIAATAGGIANSIGGDSDSGWGANMRPVCGN
jgi:hypothetical protein